MNMDLKDIILLDIKKKSVNKLKTKLYWRCIERDICNATVIELVVFSWQKAFLILMRLMKLMKTTWWLKNQQQNESTLRWPNPICTGINFVFFLIYRFNMIRLHLSAKTYIINIQLMLFQCCKRNILDNIMKQNKVW